MFAAWNLVPNSLSRQNNNNLRWWVLLTVIIGTFLGRLDQTIVNLALPKMIDDFKITVSAAGWIATAYILANAVFVPVWGKLGDTIGRKKVYITGFAIFIFGSVLAGFAWNLGSMIIFRIIQAIASSADYPTAMAIIAVTFKEGKERAQALGIWSSAFAASAVFGPLLGGPLIDNFGWRAVFLINLPIGLIGVIMALTFINESVSEKKTVTFDFWGAIYLGGALSALVLVLDKGIDWGWMSLNSIISYLCIVIFTLIFIKIEQRHPEPIVDLKFFKNHVFVTTLLDNMVVFMGLIGGIFLIPLFSQTFLGYGATKTGYLFMPLAFVMMIAAPLGGRLTGKIQPRYILAASSAIAAVGIFLFSLFLDPRSTALDVMIPLSIMAFGLGFGMSQRTTIITAAVPENEVGAASSILALVRNIAGAFGIAIFATILTKVTESNVLKLSQQSVIHSASTAAYQQFIGLITLKAQISAYQTVFVVSSAIVMLGAITSFFLIRIHKNEIVTDAEIFIE